MALDLCLDPTNHSKAQNRIRWYQPPIELKRITDRSATVHEHNGDFMTVRHVCLHIFTPSWENLNKTNEKHGDNTVNTKCTKGPKACRGCSGLRWHAAQQVLWIRSRVRWIEYWTHVFANFLYTNPHTQLPGTLAQECRNTCQEFLQKSYPHWMYRSSQPVFFFWLRPVDHCVNQDTESVNLSILAQALNQELHRIHAFVANRGRLEANAETWNRLNYSVNRDEWKEHVKSSAEDLLALNLGAPARPNIVRF